ncbi:antibiotic biosynthesis monooxygenase family protein [Luteirhabdus pelagi]|uniref:antibiotic biosynthesis monooxygenase family protein n=1 Tax=Luteirhabdus pelagi TaxID=2792783 RepID=UPI0019397041|nr:antibiotic biosynthesis monooxygenase [Luteirhabdus pelagi]
MKPKLPYYAIIFTSLQTKNIEGYSEMAATMEELAKQQPGYIGMDSAKSELGITVSYWDSLDSIKHWKAHLDHQIAQEKGRRQWYKWYNVRICKVEREYEFSVPYSFPFPSRNRL